MIETKTLEDFLTSIAASIRIHGWVSKGQAFDDKNLTSTSDIAWHEKIETNEADKKLAKEAIAWIRSWKQMGQDNEYLSKLQNECISDNVTFEQRGWIGSLIKAFENQAADFRSSQHIGQQDEEILVRVKVLKVSQTKFGFAFRVADAAGNLFTFFDKTEGIGKKGDIFKIRGKIKKHDEFKGIKSTVLSYCRIET